MDLACNMIYRCALQKYIKCLSSTHFGRFVRQTHSSGSSRPTKIYNNARYWWHQSFAVRIVKNWSLNTERHSWTLRHVRNNANHKSCFKLKTIPKPTRKKCHHSISATRRLYTIGWMMAGVIYRPRVLNGHIINGPMEVHQPSRFAHRYSFSAQMIRFCIRPTRNACQLPVAWQYARKSLSLNYYASDTICVRIVKCQRRNYLYISRRLIFINKITLCEWSIHHLIA